jgi:hypothetical protein
VIYDRPDGLLHIIPDGATPVYDISNDLSHYEVGFFHGIAKAA